MGYDRKTLDTCHWGNDFHLSSFRYIKADEDAMETSFQALEIAKENFMEGKDLNMKANSSFASLKSVMSTLESGTSEG